MDVGHAGDQEDNGFWTTRAVVYSVAGTVGLKFVKYKTVAAICTVESKWVVLLGCPIQSALNDAAPPGTYQANKSTMRKLYATVVVEDIMGAVKASRHNNNKRLNAHIDLEIHHVGSLS